MTKFVTQELETIDCGDNEWVKIPKQITWHERDQIFTFMKNDNGLTKTIQFMVKEWNFKDEKNIIAPISEITIERLEEDILVIIMKKINKKLIIDKKKLQILKEPSEDTEKAKNI